MSNTVMVDALARLAPYLNDKNVLELVVRGKNQRISAFQKIALNDLQQGEGKDYEEKHGHSGYEFNKALADHTDMLDCRRKQQPYTEQQMRVLVDQKYNVRMLLMEVLKCDVADDRKMIIETAISLLSMMTISLCYFDEVYYFNNQEVLAETDPWHSSHEKWMNAFERMREK